VSWKEVEHLLVRAPGHFAVNHRLPPDTLARGTDVDDGPLVVPLHMQERIDQVRDGHVLGAEELPQGVDDEGALGDVGPDDGDRGIPALVVDVGIEDLDIHPVGVPLLQELERAPGQVRQLVRAAPLEELWRGLAQEELCEASGQLGVRRVDLALQLTADRVNDGGGVPAALRGRPTGVGHGEATVGSAICRVCTALALLGHISFGRSPGSCGRRPPDTR
jgi:hypothetical protein